MQGEGETVVMSILQLTCQTHLHFHLCILPTENHLTLLAYVLTRQIWKWMPRCPKPKLFGQFLVRKRIEIQYPVLCE